MNANQVLADRLRCSAEQGTTLHGLLSEAAMVIEALDPAGAMIAVANNKDGDVFLRFDGKVATMKAAEAAKLGTMLVNHAQQAGYAETLTMQFGGPR